MQNRKKKCAICKSLSNWFLFFFSFSLRSSKNFQHWLLGSLNDFGNRQCIVLCPFLKSTDIPKKAVKNRKCISEGHKVSLKGQVWFSIFTALLFFKKIHFVSFFFFFKFWNIPLIFDFEGIQRGPVLQVKKLSLWEYGWFIRCRFFISCRMYDEVRFFLASYRLVSKAWTIPLESRTFLRKINQLLWNR